jgi:hypothetical protein
MSLSPYQCTRAWTWSRTAFTLSAKYRKSNREADPASYEKKSTNKLRLRYTVHGSGTSISQKILIRIRFLRLRMQHFTEIVWNYMILFFISFLDVLGKFYKIIIPFSKAQFYHLDPDPGTYVRIWKWVQTGSRSMSATLKICSKVYCKHMLTDRASLQGNCNNITEGYAGHLGIT